MLLTACGSDQPAEPTVSAVDIQNTAMAAAATYMAETQAAMPTATPIPPTAPPSPTPLPTFTPDLSLLPPTIAPIIATPTQARSGDPCAQVLDTASAGVEANGKYIRIENQSKGTATIWMTLTAPNSFGQCGYLTGFNNVIKKGDNLKMRIPSGCWLIGAYIQEKGGGQHVAGPTTHCWGDSRADEVNRIVIKDYAINVVGP